MVGTLDKSARLERVFLSLTLTFVPTSTTVTFVPNPNPTLTRSNPYLTLTLTLPPDYFARTVSFHLLFDYSRRVL